jgi:hypothetical protein
MDDEMYFKVNTLLTKANITLNDINQYGLLFSYNNDWKRSRMKKITELHAVKSPQDFKNYYSQDLDEMNRALSRIGQLSNSCDSPYFKDEKFTKEFRQLQQMLKELQQSLEKVQEELAFPECQDAPCVPNKTVDCPQKTCKPQKVEWDQNTSQDTNMLLDLENFLRTRRHR